MEALAQERDRHIAEIEDISDQNLQSSYGHGGHKKPKVDIKLNNFCVELGKVVEGVDETGIHIKELWKINQDYRDVVAQKMKSQKKRSQLAKPEMLNFEFQPAKEDVLRSFAQRMGSVVVNTVPTEYFGEEYKGQQYYSRPRNDTDGSYARNSETVPTFGMSNPEDAQKYQYNPSVKHSHENYKSHSPVRNQDYPAEHPRSSNYAKESEYVPTRHKEYNPEPRGAAYEREFTQEDQKYKNYQPIVPYNRQKSNNRESEGDYPQFRGESNYESYKNGIYDHASSQVTSQVTAQVPAQEPFGGYNSNTQNREEEEHRNIEEIKRKYAADQPQSTNIQDLYDDYRKQVYFKFLNSILAFC